MRVFCYRAVRESGVAGALLVRQFNPSQGGVGYAVKKRGEDRQGEGYTNDRIVTEFFKDVLKFPSRSIFPGIHDLDASMFEIILIAGHKP